MVISGADARYREPAGLSSLLDCYDLPDYHCDWILLVLSQGATWYVYLFG